MVFLNSPHASSYSYICPSSFVRLICLSTDAFQYGLVFVSGGKGDRNFLPPVIPQSACFLLSGYYSLFGLFLTHPLDGVFDLPYQEVYLKARLCLTGLQVRHHDVGQDLTKVLHLRLLLEFIGLLVEFEQLALQFANLDEGLYDSKRHVSRLLALQYSSEHIETTLGEHFG